jgi:hypothetical protein
MNQPAPPVSVAPQPSQLQPSDSVPLALDAWGRYVGSDGTAVEEGVCRDCGRLLYRAIPPGGPVDVWHPHTVLAGEPTNRFDGTLVTSQRGECAGAARGVGRPDPSAFVIGVPLVPEEHSGDALPCYICGDPEDHWESRDLPAGATINEQFACPSELTRAAADALRALVGLADVDHPRRRDDRV